ncbi:MAG: SAP domain-containing protein [Negativicutes bacterium]
MKLLEVKEIAKGMGIRLGKMNKAEIIRAIQAQEDNTPCFETFVENCGQENCLWRDDCIHA